MPSFLKNHAGLLAVLVTYWVAGMLLLPFYRYQLNPDAVSYIGIAREYAGGAWGAAVNGYWGPLLSWLLVPLLWLGLEPIYACKLLAVGVGLGVLVGFDRLLGGFRLSGTIRLILLFAAIPLVLMFALSVITPDLLLIGWYLPYFVVIFDESYPTRKGSGAWCGLWGALAYLTKSFAFHFFLAHFLTSHLIFLLVAPSGQRKPLAKQYLTGMAVFLAVSSLWIMALSLKYQGFTISTTGAYNYALIGPQSQGHPVEFVGLLPPANEFAATAWEDPSRLPITTWSPFASAENLRYQFKFLRDTAWVMVGFYQEFSVLWFPLLLGLLLAGLNRFRPLPGWIPRVPWGPRLWLWLSAFTLYTAGNGLFLVFERYLWVNCLLLLLVAGWLASQVQTSRTWVRPMLAAMLAATFLVSPVGHFATVIGQTNPDLAVGNSLHELSGILHRRHQIGGRIASDTRWHWTLYLTWFLGGKYYGMPQRGIPISQLERELKTHQIDYFLVWNDPREKPLFSQYRRIEIPEVPNLVVYAMKQPVGSSQ